MKYDKAFNVLESNGTTIVCYRAVVVVHDEGLRVTNKLWKRLFGADWKKAKKAICDGGNGAFGYAANLHNWLALNGKAIVITGACLNYMLGGALDGF